MQVKRLEEILGQTGAERAARAAASMLTPHGDYLLTRARKSWR